MNNDIQIKKTSDVTYEIPMSGKMKVPCKIFASEELFNIMKNDQTLTQGQNVATLPGIYKHSLIMPDGHQGYGFSIGGVAALDAVNGGISPGGIGYDINCGVRLMRTDLKAEEVKDKIKEITQAIFESVPAGLGGSNIRVTDEVLNQILDKGAKWAVENGYGTQQDLDNCEEGGSMSSADHNKVSSKSKSRGRKQLATLGSGNHFLEIQYVEEIFDKDVASVYGVTEIGQVVVMIHCGSRGLGHQVCSDYLRDMERKQPEIVKELVDRELIYAPAGSDLANDYFAAMSAAANFAWCNRHVIGHQVRIALNKVFPEAKIETLYDVAHNIAKLEEHEIDGKKVKVYVHRKGATRAFGPDREEVPSAYRAVGQPILLPGSMGTSSYVLVGTKKAMTETFGSTAHGAGRVMSRHQALKTFTGQEVQDSLEKSGVHVRGTSMKGLAEEAPGVYKNIDEVVRVSHEAGIGKLVFKVKPLSVIKG